MALRRERPRATYHRERPGGVEPVLRDDPEVVENDGGADHEGDGGYRGRVVMAKTSETRRTRLPAVLAPTQTTEPPADEFPGPSEGCPVHFYRDNVSIFSDTSFPHHSPFMPLSKRLLPWDERIERREVSMVHAYAPQKSSLRRSVSQVSPGLEAWRYVRDEQMRKRPQREDKKRAVPGSTLDKSRAAAVAKRAAERRARIGADDDPPRVSILRGGTTTIQPDMPTMYLAPASSASAPQIIYPRQSLPQIH